MPLQGKDCTGGWGEVKFVVAGPEFCGGRSAVRRCCISCNTQCVCMYYCSITAVAIPICIVHLTDCR